MYLGKIIFVVLLALTLGACAGGIQSSSLTTIQGADGTDGGASEGDEGTAGTPDTGSESSPGSGETETLVIQGQVTLPD